MAASVHCICNTIEVSTPNGNVGGRFGMFQPSKQQHIQNIAKVLSQRVDGRPHGVKKPATAHGLED